MPDLLSLPPTGTATSIVTGTFLVSWLQRAQESAQAGVLAWLIVGLAAVPSSVLDEGWPAIWSEHHLILAHLVRPAASCFLW